MALTKAEIDAVANRVLDLSEERNDARREEAIAKWKAAAPERERASLSRRVGELEKNHVEWIDLALAAVIVFDLVLLVLPPRRSRDA